MLKPRQLLHDLFASTRKLGVGLLVRGQAVVAQRCSSPVQGPVEVRVYLGREVAAAAVPHSHSVVVAYSFHW